MEVVIDTSAILAVVLDEPQRASLIRATRGTTLVAPPSLHWEVGNALTAMFKRGRLSLEQAQQALEAYGEIAIRFAEVDLRPVVDLCHRFQLYAYDGYVLRCAVEQQGPLLTLDRGLQQAGSNIGVDVLELMP